MLAKQTFNVIVYCYLTFRCWKELILIFCVILSRDSAMQVVLEMLELVCAIDLLHSIC